MMKVMNERTLNSASSMKNPLSAPARGIAFQRAILRRCGVPMYGANLLYPLSVPVYSPLRTARKAVPPRLSEGAAHKKAAAPEKKGVRLPSKLVPGGRIGGGLYQRTDSLVDPFGKGGVGVDGFEEIAGCAATLDGEGGFGDQIGSVGSGDVRSEELAAAFFNDELEQPGRVRPWPAPCRARGTGTPKFSRRTPVAWLALRRAPHPRFPGR